MEDRSNPARDATDIQLQYLPLDEEHNMLCRDVLQQLRSNQVVRKLELGGSPYFGTSEASKVLGEVVGISTTLQELSLQAVGMSSDGLGNIIRGFMGNPNSGLEKLDVSSNTGLGSCGAKLVEELLLGNAPSLKTLGIADVGFTAEDMAVVATALAENTALEDLACGGGCGSLQPDSDGPLSLILKALTPAERTLDPGGKSNATLKFLRISYEYEKGLAENLALMLRRNHFLQDLALWDFQFNREEWADVWKALKHNKSLHTLHLSSCGNGLGDAFLDLMDLLEANGRVTQIFMTETQLQAGQLAQVQEQLDRNKQLKKVQLETLEEIMAKSEKEKWNWKDRSECEEIAKLGEKLARWATSSSTAAVVPVRGIIMAMMRLGTLMDTLMENVQNDLAKSMMQDYVKKLTDQNSPMLEVPCVSILGTYAQACNLTGDIQTAVESCEKGISLTAAWSAKDLPSELQRCNLHFQLAEAYMSLNNGPQAEKAMLDARNSMPDFFASVRLENDSESMAPNTQSPGHIHQLRAIAMLEAKEGRVAFLQYHSCAPNIARKHILVAVEKLQKALVRYTTICASEFARLGDKMARVHTALHLSLAMLLLSDLHAKAEDVCKQALLAAKDVGDSRLIAGALSISSRHAASAGKYEEAEQFIRLCLAQSSQTELPFVYLELGRILQRRGGSCLPQAEEAFREAIKLWFEALSSTLTSNFRIMTLESGKEIFNYLQSCMYEIYMKAEENTKASKVREALVVAERGRCLDLMLNLHYPWMSRPRDKENLCVDHIGAMDWEKFYTDGEYAWRHLENCMAICTDVIKEQNPEVRRVTFVEYTLTESQILISVLHSHGTETQSSEHKSSTIPSMYDVDVKEAFEEMIGEEDYSSIKEHFWQLHGPQTGAAKYNDQLLDSHRMEAVNLFQVYVEKLLRDPAPKKYLVQLYELLIKPINIADNLVAGEPLIFIPHEALSSVPFVSLLSKERKHLIEEHPVGVASSLRTLGWAANQYIFLNARPTAVADKNRMLLVADPFPLGESHDSLEDSIEEVRNITSMLPDQYSSKVLVREDASLESVVLHMKTASWYHIACHGEVTVEYPQGVLFLGAPAEMNEGASSQGPTSSFEVSDQQRRGFLTPEIIAKDLGSTSTARAAVLSACKVGLGKKTAEGLLGLSRAFMQAGVPLVLAPLRPVDSKKCSTFMQHLYKKLAGGESMMFALRSTMVDVIHERVQVVTAIHKDECDDEDDEDDEEEDEEEEEEEEEEKIKWQVWDWAAWLAMGFPGVCLTSLIASPTVGNPTDNVQAVSPNDGMPSHCEASPNVGNPRHGEMKLDVANEDRLRTATVEFSNVYIKSPSQDQNA